MTEKSQTEQSSSRLLSLDVFRGLTIAGMIIVNDPGDWGYIYPPLRHADWHGITPTDFVFPFFLFIVGVSVVLAYTKRLKAGSEKSSLYRKIFVRSCLIFGLGIFLAIFPEFEFANIRYPGVLQRIAIVFFACSLLFLHTSWKQQLGISAAILLGYCLAMAFVPIPIDETVKTALETGEVQRAGGPVEVEGLRPIGDAFIAGNFEPGVNLEAYLDRKLIPGRMYEKTWDPEGILSTFPSIVTGLLGMLAGQILIRNTDRYRQSYWLLLAGFLAMVMGSVWDWFFPFNKNLWSSSFVLYTGGLASMTLGTMVWMIDIRGWKRWTYVPLVFGANAITAYVLHSMMGSLFTIKLSEDGMSLKSGFMDGLEAIGLDRTFVSLLWALTYTAIVFLPVWWMYHKRIFLKL